VSARIDLTGAEVLVTGATGGLGGAIARALAGRGARPLLTGRRAEVLAPLAAETGGRAVPVDLADPADVERLADEAAACRVLVMNAALPGSGELDAYDVAGIDAVLDVNLRAPIVLCRRLVPGLVARGAGHVVLISSLAGKAGNPASSLYSATKFGLRGFGLALRTDLHGTGVGVTVVSPGFIRDAGMFHDSGATLPPGVGTRTPQDVAAAVLRAVDTDPAELDVAPLALRAGAAAAGLAPGLTAGIARRLGNDRVSRGIGEGQSAKR
jgi:short-subunit dehydrogenase